MWQKIKVWIKAASDFLVAHPSIKALLDGFGKCVIGAVIAYLGPLIDPHSTATLTVSGLGVAIMGAVKAWQQYNHDKILAVIQDNIMASPSDVPVTNSSILTPVVPTTTTQGGVQVKKVIGLVLGFLLMSSSAFAGYLIPKSKSEKLGLSLPAGTAIYLMPIEGFDVGAGLPKPTYGVSLNEDMVLGTMVSLNGTPNLAPILGVGASLYVDWAGVINGNGPLQLMGGLNILGPDLDLFGLGNGQGLVPNVLFVKNFATGENITTGGLTVFVDPGPGTAQKILGN